MKTALMCLLIFTMSLTTMAENAVGKAINGKLIDNNGKAIKSDLSNKKYIIFYYTATK